MKKFWKKYRVWFIIGAVIALLVAVGLMRGAVDPHAGHDHANNPHTDPHTTQQNAGSHDGHNHSDYDVGKSYTVTQNANGTYSVSVRSPHNEIIAVCDGLTTKPACAKISNSVLLVGDTSNPAVSARWAIFCDGMNNKVSPRFGGCLATQGTTVVVGANNGTTVEVKDAFTGTVYSKVSLPDAAATDNRSIIQSTAWDQDGDLIVTYWAGETTKTHTVKMP